MVEWIDRLFSAIIGAVGTGLIMYIALYGKFKDLESRVSVLEKEFGADRDRTDERIFQVADLVKEVVRLAASDREEWRNLRADMKALLQAVKDGR